MGFGVTSLAGISAPGGAEIVSVGTEVAAERRLGVRRDLVFDCFFRFGKLTQDLLQSFRVRPNTNDPIAMIITRAENKINIGYVKQTDI